MAAHTPTTPTSPTPIVNLTTPRKLVEDNLLELAVITDIITKLATVMISTGEQVCGASFDWLAQEVEQRHDAIRELVSTGSFGRGA